MSAFGLSEAEWVAIGAIGTGGAFAVALFLLGVQIWDRRGEAHERRMLQARLVAAAMGPKERPSKESELGRTGIDLFNSSNEPVYRVVVGIVFLQGTGPTTLEGMLKPTKDKLVPQPVTTLSILPPGRFRTWIAGVGWTSILSGRAGAEIAFTDRAGRHWIRRAARGELEELKTDPFEHFSKSGLYGPYELGTPESVE